MENCTEDIHLVLVNGEYVNRRKTFEEVASISGLIRLVSKYKGKGKWNGKRIFELYDKGDREVAQAVGIFFKHLAIGISNLAYIFNPKRLLLVEELPIEEMSFKRSKRRGQ